jgi:uncharacterized protein YbjT (DUF2867 family)
MKTALLAGGSGLVGGYLVDQLLSDARYRRVIAIGRRPLSSAHASNAKLQDVQLDLKDLRDAPAEAQVDDVFCALGTTIKKAGSAKAFREVDFHFVLNAARWGLERGAKRLFVVSALGADPRSRIFYSRVKGEMEQALTMLTFEAVHVFRPSLILGHRRESRPAERMMQIAAPLLRPLLLGPLRPYQPVEAGRIAQAMVREAAGDKSGFFFYEWDGRDFKGLERGRPPAR